MQSVESIAEIPPVSIYLRFYRNSYEEYCQNRNANANCSSGQPHISTKNRKNHQSENRKKSKVRHLRCIILYLNYIEDIYALETNRKNGRMVRI